MRVVCIQAWLCEAQGYVGTIVVCHWDLCDCIASAMLNPESWEELGNTKARHERLLGSLTL